MVDAPAKGPGIISEEEERAGLLEFRPVFTMAAGSSRADRAGWSDSLRRKREENNETRGTTWSRNDKWRPARAESKRAT